MNKESNQYIFLYSVVLVTLVAAIMAVVATTLKPFQERNVRIEKQMDILRSVGKAADARNVKDRAQYVAEEYARYITESFIVNSLGERVDGEAFEVELEREMAKSLAERNLPVFVFTDGHDSRRYIFPLRGTGLFGALWGYVALEDDFNTIFGAVFDHKGETPGLGSNIAEPDFWGRFSGKKLFDNGAFVSVRLVKGGGTRGRPHEVDAVSGATITSAGVEDMLRSNLGSYLNFFRAEQQQRQAAEVEQRRAQEAEAEEAEELLRRQAAEAEWRRRQAAEAAERQREAAENEEETPEPTQTPATSPASTQTDTETQP